MIKKGDIVEVIKRDFSGGIDYEVGTTWCVLEDSTDLTTVYDSRQSDNKAFLFTSHVKNLSNLLFQKNHKN